ncbi:MAG: helix-turn-helix domain-containing protein [Fermentimonas sp.]|nr:helix-turn-helix domain-containing protein [Fermentimonas sp.]
MKEENFLEWPDWVETEDVINKLKITQRTLQRWRINGTIPYSRLNGRCYYRKSDIVSLLKSNYNGEKGGKL